jgi:hypothetical protein
LIVLSKTAILFTLTPFTRKREREREREREKGGRLSPEWMIKTFTKKLS